ncbi:DUF6265 family protein [Synoicihabitans lomoniglobus]|uniref:DUF6265 family protein n=1 Tax=Synoicihabitans lomoniglobus TaxID=2909285 RepID=A0AAF0CG35_9BACT|nr:DUF6265 family protein [Opitutaceae bacterium LMO-M01]
MTRILILIILLVSSPAALLLRADISSPEVRHSSADQSAPSASIAELEWMVGAWEGPLGSDGQEHIVQRPVGGQLPGFVRGWTADGAITFYEISAFAEADGSLEYRVKHFSADLAGWEPQTEFVRHRLVAREGNAWFFDGITFVRTGPETHTVYFEIPAGERAGEIITVNQTRRRPLLAAAADGAATTGEVVAFDFVSKVLADNRIGLKPERTGRVYLPPSYASSPTRRYPVVYFCHNTFWSPAQAVADGNLQGLMERAFTAGTVDEFILVIADYTGPTTGSLYENSPTSGRWLDYTIEEVVPRIDETYRTLRHRDSRAVIGDFWGGRGALVLAMHFPETFGSLYAMHPVATGSGNLPMDRLDINWPAIHAATSWNELGDSGRDRIFTAISQAFLPNANRPPFYCDFPIEIAADGSTAPNPHHTRLMLKRFLVDGLLDDHADALRSLRGVAMDWGRFDPTQAHVIANRRFSRILSSQGIPHEAEEYAGGIWDKTWSPDGRFITRVLPLLGQHLVSAEEP